MFHGRRADRDEVVDDRHILATPRRTHHADLRQPLDDRAGLFPAQLPQQPLHPRCWRVPPPDPRASPGRRQKGGDQQDTQFPSSGVGLSWSRHRTA